MGTGASTRPRNDSKGRGLVANYNRNFSDSIQIHTVTEGKEHKNDTDVSTRNTRRTSMLSLGERIEARYIFNANIYWNDIIIMCFN